MARVKYTIKQGDPAEVSSFSTLSDRDDSLIQKQDQKAFFDQDSHRIEAHFYSLDNILLSSIQDYNNYSVVNPSNAGKSKLFQISLDPERDSILNGYENGDVKVLYSFINNLFSKSTSPLSFYIKEISPDRTELRVSSVDASTADYLASIESIRARLSNPNSSFSSFIINFGSNKIYTAINIDVFNEDLILKLYEPLPLEYGIKESFFIEELVANSIMYEVLSSIQVDPPTVPYLKGPNFNVQLDQEVSDPSELLSYTEIFSSSLANDDYRTRFLSKRKEASVGVDYSAFENFIFFSSAEERLKNFEYKLGQIQGFQGELGGNLSETQKERLRSKIYSITDGFDHYDEFLYYGKGNHSWPKVSGSTSPISVTSSAAISWYDSKIEQAQRYDETNYNKLTSSIPAYLLEDPDNAPYVLFVDMIGQHFDNVWIYTKGVSDRYNADNRMEFGVSKDLVKQAVEGFGITLHGNNKALEDLFRVFGEAGLELESGVTGSVITSGSIISGSQPVSQDLYIKEVYKRIYHNIPSILKTKGTERGLRTLINSFGIPSNILPIKEFGDNLYAEPITGSVDRVFTTSSFKESAQGNTLSRDISIFKRSSSPKGARKTEVGFSPSDQVNTYLGSLSMDDYIGDPEDLYSSSYTTMTSASKALLTGLDQTQGGKKVAFGVEDFIRSVKYFDNTLFRLAAEFVPSSTKLSTGIIVKPHKLNRSKIKNPKWQVNRSFPNTDPNQAVDFTGSKYRENFELTAGVEVKTVSGDHGGSFGTELSGSTLVDRYSSSYQEIYSLPGGGFTTLSRNTHEEPKVTGEFSGSILKASSRDLNKENTYKYASTNTYIFDTRQLIQPAAVVEVDCTLSIEINEF